MLGAIVAFAGAINLFKTEMIQSLFPINVTMLAIGALAIAAAISMLYPMRCGRRGSALWWAFALAVLVSWVTHERLNTWSLEKATLMATFVPLLLFASRRILAWRDARRAFGITLLVAALYVSVGMVVMPSPDPETQRSSFDGGDSISLARMCAIGTMFGLLSFVRATGIRRPVGLGIAAVCAFAGIQTGSRGPLAMTVVAIMVALLLGRGRHKGLQIFLGVGALFIAGLVLVANSSNMAVSRILGDGTAAQSDSQRSALMSSSIDVARSHPLGVGLGNLWGYIDTGAMVPNLKYKQYPHNVVVETFAEAGWIAGILLLAMLVVSFLGVIKHRSTILDQFLMGVWIIGVGSAMTSSDLTGNRLMWVVIGLGFALAGLPAAKPASVTSSVGRHLRTGRGNSVRTSKSRAKKPQITRNRVGRVRRSRTLTVAAPPKPSDATLALAAEAPQRNRKRPRVQGRAGRDRRTRSAIKMAAAQRRAKQRAGR